MQVRSIHTSWCTFDVSPTPGPMDLSSPSSDVTQTSTETSSRTLQLTHGIACQEKWFLPHRWMLLRIDLTSSGWTIQWSSTRPHCPSLLQATNRTMSLHKPIILAPYNKKLYWSSYSWRRLNDEEDHRYHR